jgi:transglutaminase-like putative cysteine protease
MIGVDATHAWATLWTPQPPGQFEWLGLDPTNDQMVDERYIVVGRGRDYADVPPLRGIIYTNSENSAIDVAVDVVRYSGPLEGDELYA